MDEASRWRGFRLVVGRLLYRQRSYRVIFGYGLAAVGGSGQAPRVPHPARVYVNAEGELSVSDYFPPENPMPGLEREDYEREAVEAVRRHLALAP